METSAPRPTSEEAAAALLDAERSRARLVGELTLPPFFHVSLAVAVSLQIATAAIGIAAQSGGGVALAVAGALCFLAVGAVQLLAFRRLNGAWLSGLMSQVVFGTAALASTTYALAFAAAVWAGFEEAWWVVAVTSVAGGIGYAASGVRWMRAYRSDPADKGRGESLLLFALVAVALAGAAVVLVLER